MDTHDYKYIYLSEKDFALKCSYGLNILNSRLNNLKHYLGVKQHSEESSKKILSTIESIEYSIEILRNNEK